MNWGHKIILVIAVFIVSMLAMVFVAFQQDNEMIDDNYYEKEIHYQSLIDASHNLNEVSSADLIKQTEKAFVVTIPLKLLANFANGKIEFISNDNRKKDKILKLEPDTKGLFFINGSMLFPGSYKVRINWESSAVSYYKEQNLTIKE